MNPADSIAEFCHAYSRESGLHWTFNDRETAARTWIDRGITGLPAAPVCARELLAAWLADCPAAAFRRARIETAADLAQSCAPISHLILSREDWHDLAIVLSDRGFYD